MRKFYILQQKSAVSTIGQICTTACRRKSCNKSHLFKTFHQFHEAGKTLSCLDRHTGFLDNKNPITDKTGCPAYLILSKPEAGRNRENSPGYGQRSLCEDCR